MKQTTLLSFPLRLAGWAAFLMTGGGAATGQDVQALRKGNTEIGGFLGASYGVDKFRVMGGGNVGYAVTRAIMPYAEFSYFPGIGRREQIPTPRGSVTFNYAVPLADFHGGLHLRVPLKESRVVPYGVIGLGVLRSFARQEQAVVDDGLGGTFRVPVPVPARTDFAVNFGGGLRFALTESFGIRAEAKAYRPTGQFTDIFGKVEFGFFWFLR